MQRTATSAILAIALVFGLHSASGGADADDARVISMAVKGRYALADTAGELSVSAKSPGGCDLSTLKYCLCDASSNVVCRYGTHVSGKTARLQINMPEGRYLLRATDGTWFYGAEPIHVLRRLNPYMEKEPPMPAVREPEQPKAKSDLVRLWHEFRTSERLPARLAHVPGRSLGFRHEAVLPSGMAWRDRMAAWRDSAEALCEDIDQTAVRLRRLCANMIVVPPAEPGDAEILAAWKMKFAVLEMRVETEDKAQFAADLQAGDAEALLLPATAAKGGMVPFAQAFRALPPVPFKEVERSSDVSLRCAEYNDRKWFYLVNCGKMPANVRIVVPARTEESATGERVGGMFSEASLDVRLASGEMRGYSASAGYGKLSETKARTR